MHTASAGRVYYPAALMAEARELYAAGFSPQHIHDLFARRRLPNVPARWTITRWCDERARQRDNARVAAQQARMQAAVATFRLPGSTPEYLQTFVVRLRAAGVPVRTVAKVLTVVDGGDWTEHGVKVLVEEGRRPRAYTRQREAVAA